jgi:hypothetical protein
MGTGEDKATEAFDDRKRPNSAELCSRQIVAIPPSGST